MWVLRVMPSIAAALRSGIRYIVGKSPNCRERHHVCPSASPLR
jgi:hypothetical protein